MGACEGTIAGPQAGASTAGQSGAGGAGASAGSGSGGVAPTGPDPVARLHKITASAFASSLRELLGSDVPLLPVEQDLDRDGFFSVGNSTVAISPAGIVQYEAAIGAATEYVFADAARAAKVLSCMPQSGADAACAQTALGQFGRRAFRRPLSEAELNRFGGVFSAIADEAGSVLEGLRYSASAILQSPSFLYRVELGAASAADGGRSKFTSFEMASRLSAVLWNSLPDEVLLDAAARDELSSAEGVRSQAERMLTGAQSQPALSAFLDDFYDLEHLREAVKDPALFPSWSPTLRDAMEHELSERVTDMVFTQHGDFLSLYDSRQTFVNNELARLYGLPELPSDGWRAAELPAGSPRVGLLGSAAILAANALPQRTSATRRGKFVVETLLCHDVPPPPPTVVINLDETSAPTELARDRLAQHRKNPTCAACHQLMDPVGLALENFDSIGQYRTTENGKTIDPSGVLDGVAFQTAAELASMLRQHVDAAPCLVRKLYTNAQARELVEVDTIAISDLTRAFQDSGNRLDKLLVELVVSDSFRFVQPVRR